MTTQTTTSRKVLLPLATLVAAGAVAIGSGATFSSESGSAITATAGTLVHANDQDTATLTITNLKPGASETGTLTITNTGTLDSTLEAIASTGDGDLAPALTIELSSSDSGVTSYSADFDAIHPSEGIPLGALDADTDGDYITVTVKVTMSDSGDDTDNQYQGDSADMTLEFVTTQTAATNDESDSEWVKPAPVVPAE